MVMPTRRASMRSGGRRPHAVDLLAGFGRALAIVLVLLISGVGIPFGLWFLVRYQFMAQVVVTEHLNGKDALVRSARLVKGRWWHTAIMVGLFHLLVAGSGLVVGLFLLVLFAGIPLWLFSGLITLVYAPHRAVGSRRDDAAVRGCRCRTAWTRDGVHRHRRHGWRLRPSATTAPHRARRTRCDAVERGVRVQLTTLAFAAAYSASSSLPWLWRSASFASSSAALPVLAVVRM